MPNFSAKFPYFFKNFLFKAQENNPSARGASEKIHLYVGVGGADAVDVMTGMEWELKMPRLIGVHLKGELSGWAAPKDVILKLAGILTVKGGTNAIIEYFGPGTASLSATGKATICNMGAEVGATTSLFPYDDRMATYLKATGREEVAEMADSVAGDLRADADIMIAPEKYYDRVIEIDLSRLEPYINGPFTPDAATPISEFAEKVLVNGYPRKMEVGLIGSCTNSSYQDLSRAVSLARQVEEKHLKVAAPLIVNPGSTTNREGLSVSRLPLTNTGTAGVCHNCSTDFFKSSYHTIPLCCSPYPFGTGVHNQGSGYFQVFLFNLAGQGNGTT